MINKDSLLQYLLPHHFVSWCVGIFVTRRWTWLKNWQINKFMRTYNVTLAEAEKEHVANYATFNEFFIRKLKPECRPIDSSINTLISPADGIIGQVGQTHQGQMIQAKGHHYQLQDLVGHDLAMNFIDGHFVNIYLSPADYHRVHMPYTGQITATRYVPGKLFSVNPQTTAAIPHVFTRNERLICSIETEFGPLLLVMIGAMLVNGIVTKWAGKITPVKQDQSIKLETKSVIYDKGEEIAYFEFGSTVILILPKQRINWSEYCKNDTKVKMGSAIGKYRE